MSSHPKVIVVANGKVELAKPQQLWHCLVFFQRLAVDADSQGSFFGGPLG